MLLSAFFNSPDFCQMARPGFTKKPIFVAEGIQQIKNPVLIPSNKGGVERRLERLDRVRGEIPIPAVV